MIRRFGALLAALCLSIGLAHADNSRIKLHLSFDANAARYFSFLSTFGCATPTGAFRTAVNNYFVSEKTAGNWGNQEGQYITATTDSCTASVNLAQPALYRITWNGSCTFSLQNGLNGDATTCWGDTGVNESALVYLKQNSAHTEVWAAVSATSRAIGVQGNFHELINNQSTKVTAVSSLTSLSDAGSVAGLQFADRTQSSCFNTGVNGSVTTSCGASTSSALTASHMVLCRGNTAFCGGISKILFAGFGGPMHDEAAHYTNVRALLLALGVTGI